MDLILGYFTEHINTFVVNLGLKGISEEHPYYIKQAEPITPTILMEIYMALDNYDKIREYCLLVFFSFHILFIC